MKYVLSIERLARQDGKKEGKKEGIEEGRLSIARENILEILELRFNSIPAELIEAINSLANISQLKILLKQAVTIGTIEEFEQFMAEITK